MVATHFYWLLVGILVVWRITHLFYGEDGPGNVLVKLRRAAGNGFWGSLLDCFYCLSLWIAAPFAYWLGEGWKHRLLLWPALSAGATLLERLTDRDRSSSSVEYLEDEENDNVLRPEPNAAEKDDLRSVPK